MVKDSANEHEFEYQIKHSPENLKVSVKGWTGISRFVTIFAGSEK
jgi:hypothetical protein